MEVISLVIFLIIIASMFVVVLNYWQLFIASWACYW